MLSIRQPFRPKDLVEIEGELGHVIRLTSRATILLSLDGNHVRLPNATVFKAKIINYTRNDERRFTFGLGIDPSADIAKAQEIALGALTELPFVLETPAPAVWVEGLGASTIDLTAAAWIMQHQTSDRDGQGRGDPRREGAAGKRQASACRNRHTGLSGRRHRRQPRPRPPPAPRHRPRPGRVSKRRTSARKNRPRHSRRMIEVERQALPDNDLLRREAPQE